MLVWSLCWWHLVSMFYSWKPINTDHGNINCKQWLDFLEFFRRDCKRVFLGIPVLKPKMFLGFPALKQNNYIAKLCHLAIVTMGLTKDKWLICQKCELDKVDNSFVRAKIDGGAYFNICHKLLHRIATSCYIELSQVVTWLDCDFQKPTHSLAYPIPSHPSDGMG